MTTTAFAIDGELIKLPMDNQNALITGVVTTPELTIIAEQGVTVDVSSGFRTGALTQVH